MKSKLRLCINLAVICLCIFAMVVGVYSATTATLTVSGQIGFKAHDCELEVKGTKTGYASEDLLTYETDNVDIDMDTTTEGVQDTGKVSGKGGERTISTLNLGTLNFTDLAEDTIPPIVITLTFINLSPFQVSALVTVDETTLTNIAYTRQYAMGTDISATKTDHSGAIILEPASNTTLTNKAVTFTLTFKVATPEQSIDPSSTLTINANFAKYDSSALPTEDTTTTSGLTYTLIKDPTNNANYNAWSVKGNTPTSTISVAPVIHDLPVTTVAENAFKSNTTITEVTLPNTITLIDDYAFDGCTNIADISMANTIKTIDPYAFQNCTSLTSIDMPNSLTGIGTDAFSSCNGLTKVNISSLESWCNINFEFDSSNPLYYAKNLYLNDVLVEDLVIPESITEIKDYAFYNCSGLTGSLTIPDSVTTIGNDAFHSCSGFNGSLTIPDSVTSIGNNAFSGCSGLTGSLTIPDSVTIIGDWAFSGCRLTSVTFERETPPTFGARVFNFTYLTSIYVPSSTAVTAYATALVDLIRDTSIIQVKQ